MINTVIILAAGSGSRMKSDRNKMFLEIGGMEILERSILAFESNDEIDEIIIVSNKMEIDHIKRKYLEESGFRKIKNVVEGGKERQDSVYSGICAISGKSGIVLIHDGARPFIRKSHISESISAAKKYGAVCLAVPVKDTIKRIDRKGFVDKTLNREMLWAVQTPQVFKYDIIRKAHEKAREEGFLGTDDTSLVERIGFKVYLVRSDYDNIKITTAEDVELARTIADKIKMKTD